MRGETPILHVNHPIPYTPSPLWGSLRILGLQVDAHMYVQVSACRSTWVHAHEGSNILLCLFQRGFSNILVSSWGPRSGLLVVASRNSGLFESLCYWYLRLLVSFLESGFTSGMRFTLCQLLRMECCLLTGLLEQLLMLVDGWRLEILF